MNVGQEVRDVLLLYGAAGVLTALNSESLAALRLADRVQLHLLVTVASRVVRAGLLAWVWWAGGGLTEVVLTHIAASAVNGLGMFASAALSAPLAGLAGFLRSASVKVPPPGPADPPGGDRVQQGDAQPSGLRDSGRVTLATLQCGRAPTILLRPQGPCLMHPGETH